MGDIKDRVGNAGMFLAGGFFKTALYVCVAVLIIWVGKITYTFGYNVFNQQPMSPGEGQEVTVVIKEDASVYQIGKTLKSKGLIESPLVFCVQVRLYNYNGKLKPGTYLISTAYTPARIMGILAGETEEQEALAASVPIIRREMQSFIKVLLAVKKPGQILEVGTAVGFSTLLMCEYGRPDLQITTIENYEKRIPIAKQNFKKAGREHQITLLEGDAGKYLKELDGKFDLIFMDAAKGQYIHWLPDVVRLLAPEGILISDNVLQEGELIESHYLVERRNRTIYKRMREYLYQLKHYPLLLTTILPLGDGVSVSVKQS